MVYTLAKEFKPYLELWLKDRAEKGIESEWLFPDPADPTKHMHADTLNSWANTFSRILGVDFYFHACRHRACTALIKAGLPDDVVQHLFGWSTRDLVGLYTDIDPIDNLGQYFQNGKITGRKSKDLGDL